MTPKLVAFKYQGPPKKSRFKDKHAKIQDIELIHIDWNAFLTLCNKPLKSSMMASKLIQSGLVNFVSHPTLFQSFELIMILAQHYVPDEKVVKSMTREIVLDLRPQYIEKVFHLRREDQYLQISYEGVNRWYMENEKEVKELVESTFLIDMTPLACRVGKVDKTWGYMKVDIMYSIVLLSRTMGLLIVGHLETWMVHFI